MVVCKFFLEGTCKFGSSCRFEHPRDARSRVSFSSTENKDYVKVLQTDLLDTNIWPLSCYGMPSIKEDIASHRDFSFEEVRWEAYQKGRTGLIDQHIAEFRAMIQKYKDENIILSNNAEKLLKGEFFPMSMARNVSVQNPFTPMQPGLNMMITSSNINNPLVFSSTQTNPSPAFHFPSSTPAMLPTTTPLTNPLASGMNPPFMAHLDSSSNHPSTTMSSMPTTTLNPFHFNPPNRVAIGNHVGLGNAASSLEASSSSSNSSSKEYPLSGKLRGLTEEETKAYQASSFSLFKIPTIPPF